MKLTLTTWDRMTIVQLVGALEGDAALMWKCSKVFDAVKLTDDEEKEIGLQRAGNAIYWDDDTKVWPVEIADKEAAALVTRVVQENKKWPAARAREVAGLYKALGFDWPPKEGEAAE
jgi:hypothetical protein